MDNGKTIDTAKSLFGMDKAQSESEVKYKMSQKMLKILLRKGIITEDEFKVIDGLNRDSFSPMLSKVYV